MTKDKESKPTKQSEKTTEKKSKSPKSTKKRRIIIASILAGLVALGLAIWGIVTLVIANQPLEQDWAQAYYVYLDENKLDPELKDGDGKTQATADEYSVDFYDVEGIDDPVMVVNYVDDSTNYVSYYWLADGKVQQAFVYSPSEIKLLHNISDNKTNYYIHYQSDGTDYYQSLGDQISRVTSADDPAHVKDEPSYSFNSEDVKKVTDKDGKEHALTKYEETFVEIKDEQPAATLPINYDKDTLKQAVKNESYEYQALQEVAQKHADMIKQVISDIEQRKDEIAKVEKENAEIEAQKQAEEAARLAEEEAKKGIKLEGYTIAYGTYQLDVWDDIIVGEDIVINRDGTCTYAGKACTWKIGSRDFTQSPESTNVHQAIIFDTGNGYGSSYFAYGNNEFGDGDLNRYTLKR